MANFLAFQDPKSPNFLRSRLRRSRNCPRIIFGGEHGKNTTLELMRLRHLVLLHVFLFFYGAIAIGESKEAPSDTFVKSLSCIGAGERVRCLQGINPIMCLRNMGFEPTGRRALYVYPSFARPTSNAYL